jgi:hypothetical protein
MHSDDTALFLLVFLAKAGEGAIAGHAPPYADAPARDQDQVIEKLESPLEEAAERGREKGRSRISGIIDAPR